MKRPIAAALGAAALLAAAIATPDLRAADAPADKSQRATEVANPHGDLKTDCEDCHTAKSWNTMRRPLRFRHAETGFALQGAHANARCAACHRSLEFAKVATSCGDCHRDIHQGRAGVRCQDCHTPTGWTNRSRAVAQHGRTGFPLRGMHALVECARCHIGSGEENQSATSRECYSCHAISYATAQNPNHAAAGYSTHCEGCHDPGQARWGGAGFNHALTGFVLTGAHRTAACASCHVGGRYAGTPRDCYACHQADYAGTTNPNHQTSGYPTGCAACHSTTAWSPANIDHDRYFFRIYSGSHQGRWTSCSQCHINSASFADFSCLTCHAHDQATMDSKHAGRSGYVYDSAACYGCHPRA
jgi:cytochrome c7-like protein